MKLGVAELLSKVNELRDESQQLVVLRNNDSAALRAIIDRKSTRLNSSH